MILMKSDLRDFLRLEYGGNAVLAWVLALGAATAFLLVVLGARRLLLRRRVATSDMPERVATAVLFDLVRGIRRARQPQVRWLSPIHVCC